MILVLDSFAILTSFAAALIFRFALDSNRIGRTTSWLVSSLVVASRSLFVPETALPHRFVAALVSVAVVVKLYDLFRQPKLAQRLTLTSYVSYLANWGWLVLRKPPPGVPVDRDFKQLVLSIPLLILLGGLCKVVFSTDYSDVPFAVEHCLKVTTLVTVVILLANASARAWRLLGGRVLEPMLNPAVARTPADFWRRWNPPAQQFFQEYAFQASGGFHNPVRGILVSFAASGIVHEYRVWNHNRPCARLAIPVLCAQRPSDRRDRPHSTARLDGITTRRRNLRIQPRSGGHFFPECQFRCFPFTRLALSVAAFDLVFARGR